MTQQELHEIEQGTLAPEQVSMTLAEFLENDIDGYEYVKGELVPMFPPTRIHTDAQSRVVDKAFAYLSAGTRLVWVLEPRSKTVTIYRSENDIALLTLEDTLTGEDVVPGFVCPVVQLFA